MAHLIRYSIAALALTLAHPASAKPRTVTSDDLKFSVVVPGECKVEEGPGTVEAICSADFDEAKSAEMAAANAVLLEIDAERAPTDAKAYAEADFKQELPEAVCGEGDATKVKLADIKAQTQSGATIYTAMITCPELKFLGLGERQAMARYIIQPGYRYRLMARALTSDMPKAGSAMDSFLTSFKSTAESK